MISGHSATRGRRIRGGERGNALLMVLVLLVAAGILTVAILTSLLGEIQGAISYRHAVQALGAAEAGVHYGTAMINGSGSGGYAGETDRVLTHPILGQVGLFDVAVRCSDGTVPANPNPCAGAPQPNVRVISSTGFVPTRALSLGRRTVVMSIRQDMITAVCGVDGVTLDRNTVTRGNVGSNANISLLGPAGARAHTLAFGGQPGNATAGGTVTCSGSCGPPENQVDGTTTNNFPGGQVCRVLPAFTCNPGTTDVVMGSGASLTISAANGNTVLRDVTLGSSSTLIFATTSVTEVLTVQMRNLTIGQLSRVRVTGPGKVVLHTAGPMQINQGTLFGVDASDADIPPGNLLVRSCSVDSGPDFAVEFHQTGRINAILLAPNGTVQLDQAALTRGAIQSRTVQFDRNTDFNWDTTGLAYNVLTSWREQP